MFEQRAKIRTNDTDGDETGRHWTVYYYVYAMQDEPPLPIGPLEFGIFEGDNYGNSKIIATCTKEHEAIRLASAMGEIVEYREGIPVRKIPASNYAGRTIAESN